MEGDGDKRWGPFKGATPSFPPQNTSHPLLTWILAFSEFSGTLSNHMTLSVLRDHLIQSHLTDKGN